MDGGAPNRSTATVRPDSASIPLVVDLDGTLVAGDLLAETLIAHLAKQPLALPSLAGLLRRGKAALKHFLVEHHLIDAGSLPYREPVLVLIREARACGRPVYLATASHERYATAIADHLGLFDGVFATGPGRNLAGGEKARLLIENFGDGGFDYVGNSAHDLEVWRHARRCYAVATPPSVRRRLAALQKETEEIPSPRASLRIWARALRVHQYAKNSLILLPVIAGHALRPEVLVNALLAFVSFSLAASAIYLVNDMADVADDRAHPTKKRRPIASGLISIHQAAIAVPMLLLASAAVAMALPIAFWVALAGYLGLTTAYSFWLKRKMLVDVIVLALLYTARLYAGSAATGIEISDWLLAFSLFAFTSLALMKRYTELLVRVDNELPDASNRNYRKTDVPIIGALAAATAVNTVLVLALYLRSPEVTLLYQHPRRLWLLCPLLLFLASRSLLMAHRRLMDDDPVVWALNDRVCRIGIVVAGAIIAAGALP